MRIVPLIAIDGPAASGKSTAARRLAHKLRLPYLYTGAMYRALTWLAMKKGVDLRDTRALKRMATDMHVTFKTDAKGGVRVFLRGGTDVSEALQHPDVARNTSGFVASQMPVRQVLVARQRSYATSRGLVAEGRDCGSVIFPDAPFKFYVTADFTERVARRKRDLDKIGHRLAISVIARDMKRRDREDRERPGGALLIMPDAWIIDNTRKSSDETIEMMTRRIRPYAV